MRKIKFRGWDASGEKGWVFGDLVHNQRVTATGLRPRVMVDGYEVLPESVGQYTGLKDLYGREVYEGDIVYMDGVPEEKRVVVFYEEAFNIATRAELECLRKGEHPYMNDYAHMTCLNEWSNTGLVRAIGNIYRNPELLNM